MMLIFGTLPGASYNKKVFRQLKKMSPFSLLRIVLIITMLLFFCGFYIISAGADAGYEPDAENVNTNVLNDSEYSGTAFTQYDGFSAATLAASEGGPVSIDLRGVDLKDALSALAIQMGVNIIIAGDETQQVTLQLQNVTPRQAMEIIINSKGMDYLEEGGIIVVGETGTLQKNFFSRMIYTRYDTLYVPGEEFQETLNELDYPHKSIISKVNPNFILVEGTAQTLRKVSELIYTMDTEDNVASLDYRSVALNQISTARAAELLEKAGFKLNRYIEMDKKLLVFDRELFSHWEQVENFLQQIDLQQAVKEKTFVFQLKNVAAKDAEERLQKFAFGGEIKTVSYQNPELSREIMIICPPAIEKDVRAALVAIDQTRQKIKVPIASMSGDSANQGLNALRSLLSQLSGVPVSSMGISNNLSGDSDNPAYVLWVEETPDKVQMLKELVDKMGGGEEEEE
jgi:type IV pilus assembly protein PilQ